MPTLDPNLYTVAWITPLEIEVQAARHMLDKVHSGGFPVGPGDDYLFHAGEIHGHNVVIATFAAGQWYGTNSAACLASHIRKSFPKLWFGLLVGVAAGLPNHSCLPPRDIYGDIPAIVPYGLGKQKGVILGYYRDILETAMKFPDPGQENDVLYLSDDNLPLLKSSRDRDKLRDRYNVIGLEMEAAGVMNEILACLRDLLVTDPEAERRRIEATKGGLLDDSFRWLSEPVALDQGRSWKGQDHAHNWNN
ncbi:hypothetical protein BDW60DRAFT_222063 [Aspergillus nidulans var. acristatus]